MNIPTELTKFVPEKVDLAAFPSWEIKTDTLNRNIEIRNVLFSRKAIRTIVAVIAWMTFIVGIIAVFVHLPGTPEMTKSDLPFLPDLTKEQFLLFGAFVALLAVGLIALFGLGSTWSNALLWKGGFRFQYDKSNDEVFFPREHALYSRNDYNELILGTTEGYDTTEILEQHERNRTTVKQDRSEPTLITATYFLVCRKDGTWVRHLVGYDKSSKTIQRDVTKLQEILQCKKTTRKMTVPECFATQSEITGHSSLPPKGLKPVNYVAGYTFCAIFMLLGLVFAGLGFYEFVCMGRVSWFLGLSGILFFLSGLGGMFLLRRVARRGHPSAC